MTLAQRYPWCLHVPIGLALTLSALALGLVLPVLHVEKLVFWHDDHTILTGIGALWEEGHLVAALLVFGLSVVFPILKMAALLWVWYVPAGPRTVRLTLRITGLLGKWSMLDVFVIALFIVLATTEAIARVTPQAGLYVIAGAAAGLMLLTFEIERLAKRRLRARASARARR